MNGLKYLFLLKMNIIKSISIGVSSVNCLHKYKVFHKSLLIQKWIQNKFLAAIFCEIEITMTNLRPILIFTYILKF